MQDDAPFLILVIVLDVSHIIINIALKKYTTLHHRAIHLTVPKTTNITFHPLSDSQIGLQCILHFFLLELDQKAFSVG